MCGIAACFGLSRPETDAFVERALGALAHRGPDGSATRVVELPDGQLVGLAHTRLAIVDLSADAAQPMSTEDGRLWLLANGEILNAAALRAELEADGHRFRSLCDVEVILHGYAEWGAAVSERLAGFFAAILVDLRDDRVALLRDPLGIKPLFASAPPGRWVASVPLDAPRPTAAAAVAFLSTGRYPATRAQAVPAGLELNDRDTEAAEPDLRAIVEATIESWCASDVPVAVALSGGLDSGIIAAVLQRVRNDAFAVCVQPDDPVLDESDLAQVTASRLGLPLTLAPIDGARVAEDLDALVDALPFPTHDGLNLGAAARQVAAAGGKVLMVGTGADELFCGYAHARWFEHIVRRGALFRAARLLAAFDKRPAAGRPWKLRQIADAPNPRSAAYDSLRALLPAGRIRRLVPSAQADNEEAARDRSDSLLQLELDHYLRDVLLRDADTFGMRHGVEVRPPFLDAALVQRVAASPTWRRTGKRALADAFADLFPQGIPRKRTFALPIAGWLRRSPLRDRIEAELSSRDAASGGGILDPDEVRACWHAFLDRERGISGTAMWGLVILALWAARNQESQPRPPRIT